MSILAVPVNWRSLEEQMRLIAGVVNQLEDGRSNAFGSVTLTINVTSSTLTDPRIGTDSVITFMPTTANAAAEIGAGGMYVGTVSSGSAIITHANNANADRTFSYSIQG